MPLIRHFDSAVYIHPKQAGNNGTMASVDICHCTKPLPEFKAWTCTESCILPCIHVLSHPRLRWAIQQARHHHHHRHCRHLFLASVLLAVRSSIGGNRVLLRFFAPCSSSVQSSMKLGTSEALVVFLNNSWQISIRLRFSWWHWHVFHGQGVCWKLLGAVMEGETGSRGSIVPHCYSHER